MKRRKIYNVFDYMPSMCDIKKYHFRRSRLKVKRHKSHSKKSFYKTKWWELHFRNDKNVDRYVKHQKRDQERLIRKYDRNNVSYLWIHKGTYSFHNGDSGVTYTFVDRFGKTVYHFDSNRFLHADELKLKTALLGYDQYIESHQMSMIIE